VQPHFCCSHFHFSLSTVHAQAFTYQGRPEQRHHPATGSYDLRFALFDALTAGAQQGNRSRTPPPP